MIVASSHAIARAAERAGVDLDENTISEIVRDITDTIAGDRHGAILLQRHGVEWWHPLMREVWMLSGLRRRSRLPRVRSVAGYAYPVRSGA